MMTKYKLSMNTSAKNLKQKYYHALNATWNKINKWDKIK